MRLKRFIKTAEKIKIHQFIISKKSKAFIVAEISGNHAGRINNIFNELVATVQKEYFEMLSEFKISINDLYKSNNKWYNNY